MEGNCGPCGHPWDWHGKREDGSCNGAYVVGMESLPCRCKRRRKLHAAAAGNSGYTSISQDYKDILRDAVDNFYGMKRVRELAQKWRDATELGTGNPSVVAQAFAAELHRAIEGA